MKTYVRTDYTLAPNEMAYTYDDLSWLAHWSVSDNETASMIELMRTVLTSEGNTLLAKLISEASPICECGAIAHYIHPNCDSPLCLACYRKCNRN